MKTSNLRSAFNAWCDSHPYVTNRAALYNQVLRSRKVPLVVLRHAPFAALERELHFILLGFGMRAAGVYAASLRQLADRLTP